MAKLVTLMGLGRLSADTESVFFKGCNNLIIPPAGGVLGSSQSSRIESAFSTLGEILFDFAMLGVEVVANGDVFRSTPSSVT